MYEGLAATFDTVAEQYERSRPGYPAELFANLAELAELGDTAEVLEIGVGTGQATRGLRARGWRVVALEPGPQLAAVASRVLGQPVEVTTFEDWDGTGPFDLVVAATAWHWLDPDVAYAKVARQLRPGGSLAIIGTNHVLPPDGDPFFREVQAAYEAAGMSDGSSGPPPPEDVRDAWVATEFFELPRVRRYLTGVEYDADGYVQLIGTYSNHIEAGSDQLYADIRRLIEARGGTVRKHYLTVLQVARRRGRTGS